MPSLDDDLIENACLFQIDALFNEGPNDARLSGPGKGHDPENRGFQIITEGQGTKARIIAAIVRWKDI